MIKRQIVNTLCFGSYTISVTITLLEIKEAAINIMQTTECDCIVI